MSNTYSVYFDANGNMQEGVPSQNPSASEEFKSKSPEDRAQSMLNTGSVTATATDAGQTIIENQSRAAVDAKDLQDGQFTGSVVSTAKTSYGSPKDPGNVTEKDIVEVPEMGETDVKTAARMGFLQQTPDGRYVDADQQPSFQQDQQGNDSTEDDIDYGPDGPPDIDFDDQTDEVAAEIASALPQEQVMMGLDEVGYQGSLSDKTVERVASALGTDAETASSKIAEVKNTYVKAGEKAMQDAGLGTPELQAEFLKSMDEDELASLRKATVMTNSTKQLNDKASQFVEDMDQRDPDGVINMAKESGIDAYRDSRTGQVVLDLPEMGQVPWKLAIREGFITRPFKPRKSK